MSSSLIVDIPTQDQEQQQQHQSNNHTTSHAPTHHQYSNNSHDHNNNNNNEEHQERNENYNIDDQGRKWMIVGDVNLKGQFIKKVLGNLWAPFGASNKSWYSCIFAPAAPSHFLVTGFLITVCVVLFSIWVVPAEEVWSRVIIAILWLINLITIFLGTATDPGLVLPARHGDIFYPEGEKNVFVSREIGEVNLRPCNVCKITRPYRVSHCPQSQVCVEEYDHFCGVFGNVIGKRTMRYFLGSIWSAMATFMFMTIRSAFVLKDIHDIGLDKVKAESGGSRRIILVYVFLFMGSCFFICGGCFSSVHVHNAFLGRNERDAMRTKNDSEHHAYGVHGKYECTCTNFCSELCGDKGESVLLTLTSEEDMKSM